VACCHCSKYRAFHGNFAAYVMTIVEDLKLVKDGEKVL
jgi:hypothetical protein